MSPGDRIYVERVDPAEAYRALLLPEEAYRAGSPLTENGLRHPPKILEVEATGDWLLIAKSPTLAGGRPIDRYGLHRATYLKTLQKLLEAVKSEESFIKALDHIRELCTFLDIMPTPILPYADNTIDIDQIMKEAVKEKSIAFLGRRDGMLHGALILPSHILRALLDELSPEETRPKEGLTGAAIQIQTPTGPHTLYTVLTESQFKLLKTWIEAHNQANNYLNNPKAETWRKAVEKLLEAAGMAGIHIKPEEIAQIHPANKKPWIDPETMEIELSEITLTLRTKQKTYLQLTIQAQNPPNTTIKITQTTRKKLPTLPW